MPQTETAEAPAAVIAAETKKTGQFMASYNKEHQKNEPVAPQVKGTEVPKVESTGTKTEQKTDSGVKEEQAQPTKSLLDSFAPSATPSEPKKEAKPISDKEENLATLRMKYQEAEKAKSELEKRVKEIEARIPTDYESLKSTHQKLTEDHNLVLSELKKTNLSATPEFKEKYDNKLNSTVNSIQKALATSEVDASGFMDLIKQPESKERTKKISEAVSEMDDFTKSKVSGSVAEYDRIRDEREQELSNPDPSLKAFNEQREMQSRKQQESAARAIDDTISKVEKEYAWLRDGENQDWNKTLSEMKGNARKLWTNPTSIEDQAAVAFAAASAPVAWNLVHQAKQEIETLNATIAQLRGATPQTHAGKPAEVLPPKGKGSFMNKFNATVKG